MAAKGEQVKTYSADGSFEIVIDQNKTTD